MGYYRKECSFRSHPVQYYHFDDLNLTMDMMYCDGRGQPQKLVKTKFSRLVNDVEAYHDIKAYVQRRGVAAPTMGPKIFSRTPKDYTTIFYRDGVQY